MPSLGAGELVVIFVLVLVLFGPHRLPELARGLGKATREIRKLTSEFQSQLAAITDLEDEPKPAPAPAPGTTPATTPAPRLDQMNAAPLQWTPHEDALPQEEPAPSPGLAPEPPAVIAHSPEQAILPFDIAPAPTQVPAPTGAQHGPETAQPHHAPVVEHHPAPEPALHHHAPEPPPHVHLPEPPQHHSV